MIAGPRDRRSRLRRRLPADRARRSRRASRCVHCGWRGLEQGIVARGAAAVGATAAAIGPGIGPCCYEVDESDLWSRDGPAGDLDLREARGVRGAVERVERRASAPAARRSSSSRIAATATRGGRQASSGSIGRRAEVPGLIHGLEPDEDRRQPRRGARARRARGRDPRRQQVRAGGGDGGAGRGRRPPRRREPPAGPRSPSTSAGAMPSSGTSSATCRAARSSSCCRSAA